MFRANRVEEAGLSIPDVLLEPSECLSRRYLASLTLQANDALQDVLWHSRNPEFQKPLYYRMPGLWQPIEGWAMAVAESEQDFRQFAGERHLASGLSDVVMWAQRPAIKLKLSLLPGAQFEDTWTGKPVLSKDFKPGRYEDLPEAIRKKLETLVDQELKKLKGG